jgi:hypothetical protein
MVQLLIAKFDLRCFPGHIYAGINQEQSVFPLPVQMNMPVNMTEIGIRPISNLKFHNYFPNQRGCVNTRNDLLRTFWTLAKLKPIPNIFESLDKG